MGEAAHGTGTTAGHAGTERRSAESGRVAWRISTVRLGEVGKLLKGKEQTVYQSSSGRQRRSGPEVTDAQKSVAFAPDRPTKNKRVNNIHSPLSGQRQLFARPASDLRSARPGCTEASRGVARARWPRSTARTQGRCQLAANRPRARKDIRTLPHPTRPTRMSSV